MYHTFMDTFAAQVLSFSLEARKPPLLPVLVDRDISFGDKDTAPSLVLLREYR